MKLNTPLIKISDKGFSKRTVIKDIKGHILQFEFQNPSTSEQVGDIAEEEVLAVLSVETTQTGDRRLWLSVYEICETDSGGLQQTVMSKCVLCDDVLVGVTPRIALQSIPADEFTVVAVAVFDTIYIG